jgi:hypothetical protein
MLDFICHHFLESFGRLWIAERLNISHRRKSTVQNQKAVTGSSISLPFHCIQETSSRAFVGFLRWLEGSHFIWRVAGIVVLAVRL